MTVNDEPAVLGMRVDVSDSVAIDGKACITTSATASTGRVIGVHKPADVVCTRHDPEGRATIFELLPATARRWVMVGRLDLTTSGLVLFTDDGELAHRLTHPSYQIPRKYAVRVLGTPTPEVLAAMLAGVEVDGEILRFDRIAAAGGEGANRWFDCSLHTGRNREVRRLWEAHGLAVSRLMRTSYGVLSLPREIRPGLWFEVEGQTLERVYQSVDLPPPGAKTPGPTLEATVRRGRAGAATRPGKKKAGESNARIEYLAPGERSKHLRRDGTPVPPPWTPRTGPGRAPTRSRAPGAAGDAVGAPRGDGSRSPRAQRRPDSLEREASAPSSRPPRASRPAVGEPGAEGRRPPHPAARHDGSRPPRAPRRPDSLEREASAPGPRPPRAPRPRIGEPSAEGRRPPYPAARRDGAPREDSRAPGRAPRVGAELWGKPGTRANQGAEPVGESPPARRPGRFARPPDSERVVEGWRPPGRSTSGPAGARPRAPVGGRPPREGAAGARAPRTGGVGAPGERRGPGPKPAAQGGGGLYRAAPPKPGERPAPRKPRAPGNDRGPRRPRPGN